MAWRRSGDKPLSEPMMDSLLTHICVTRPQWVNMTQFCIQIWSSTVKLSLSRTGTYFMVMKSVFPCICLLYMNYLLLGNKADFIVTKSHLFLSWFWSYQWFLIRWSDVIQIGFPDICSLLSIWTIHPVQSGIMAQSQNRRISSTTLSRRFNSLVDGRCGSNFTSVRFTLHLQIDTMSTPSRVGNSVPAWNVSLWLLWRVRCDLSDGIVEAKLI